MTRALARLVWLALPSISMAACSVLAGATPGILRSETCKGVDVPGARCWSLTVYENRAAGRGRTIPLWIVVLPATGATRDPDPVVFLAGGPGQAATMQAAEGFIRSHPLRARRDFVFVDQRGTGRSHDLRCRFYGPPSNPQSYFGDFMPPDKVRACRDDLSREADLAQYTTDNSVADLDEVRRALGYERINIIGGSYGTRYAMEYVRAHDAHVRSVVLYGTVPPSEAMPEGFGRSAQQALDGILDECTRTPACASAFPQIADESRRVFDELANRPATARLSDGGRDVTVRMTRDAVAEDIRYMTYSSGQASRVPLYLHEAATGNYAPIAADLRRRRGDGTFDALYLAITCTEDVPFLGPGAAQTDSATYLGDYRVRQQRAACDEWPHGPRPSWHASPVRSSVPVVMLTGTLDPVTPPAFAEEVRRTLPNGRVLLVQSGGHVLDGLTSPECLDTIENAVITSGSIDGLDTSCVATMHRPGFAIR